MIQDSPVELPARIADVDELEDVMTTPPQELISDLGSIEGDILILGVSGKMGPTLARMARRAAPHKRILGVARFSKAGMAEQLTQWGIECLTCDLLNPDAVARLPRIPNVLYMAGHKFGATENAALTWAINAGAPYVVANVFRESRIVAFSTACVYPFVDVRSSGATEETATQPPPGDYAASCVGREQMFRFSSLRYGTPGRLVRLSYAIDLRYGVLHDVARSVLTGQPLDQTMGYVNVIWQGDANERSLRLLAHCTSPTTPINVSGSEKISIRWLAEQFGQRFGKTPGLMGQESNDAWLIDTTESRQLLGETRVTLEKLIDWEADWVARGQSSLGKKTHFETRDGRY